MLDNLCFSPIPKEKYRKESLSIDDSSLMKEKSKIRGFNFMNMKKKQESFLKEIGYKSVLPLKNIRSFDFKQKKERIRGFLIKKTIKIGGVEEKKKIKSFNFRQNVKNN